MAYIKINISRSRKISSKALTSSLFASKLDANGSFHMDDRVTNNDVKLSILADIGSSSFVYDMHNIKEIFVFPKIWYRRSLARRLFFGDETLSAYQTEPTEDPASDLMNDTLIEMKRR